MDILFKFAKKDPKEAIKHRNDKTQKSIVTDVGIFLAMVTLFK